MGTLLDIASLVTIPSGYKAGTVYSVVPTDGAGDLSFTRSNDTATRVGPNGLIEKVRTNLVLQSEAFNTTWVVNGISVTANTTPNPLTGTTTADTITATNTTSFHIIEQSVTYSAGEATVSVYVKANGYSWFVIDPTFTNAFGYFNVTTGVVGTKGSACTTSITNVGGGWYRCSVTFTATASAATLNFSIRNADNGGSFLGDGVSGFFIYGAQAEMGVATDYIPTTTTAVSVGPVANLPRLDYLNSTCPNLLLEPQRTNVLTYSEQLGNAVWSKYLTTITENNIVSPSGYQDADLATSTAGGDLKNILTLATSTTYTASFYVKKGTAVDAQYRVYNFDAGVNVVTATSYISQTSTSTWSRVSVTFTTGATGTNYGIYLLENSSAGTMYFWGAQVEAGAYATSYIPTLGASSTRGVDACSKTGISSLIGQTEGTIFVDINYTNTNNPVDATPFRVLGSGSAQMYVEINTNETFEAVVVNSAGTLVFNSTSSAQVAGRKKMAIAYKGSDFAYYINGTQIAVQTSGAFASASLDSLNLGMYSSGVQVLADTINQAIVFPTRLSNAEIAQLTTI